jgi:hypothetical protein
MKKPMNQGVQQIENDVDQTIHVSPPVDLTGLEPATSALQTPCSPN